MRRFVAAVAAVLVVGLFGAPAPVGATTGLPNEVVDFETLFASIEADGTPRNVRLVNTLRILGEGNVVVTDPTSTEDFRVLSGFSSPEVGDGEVTYTVEGLDGAEEFVSVSTPDVEPPVSMLVTYLLDGERVEPEDVVGASGDVRMVFDVANNTSESQELTYKAANGEQQTFTDEVPLPMVAQLQMELPSGTVTGIDAPEAEKVTDSRGNITLLWNLVMVPPIGDTVQSVEVGMRAEDFQVGAVRLTAVPVAPKNREFLAFAEDELAHGQESAAGLYEGSTVLGSNMDSLHDGTLDLLDGMEQLLAGAQELAAGLGEAFSGSGQLTSGLGRAHSGSGELSAGLGDAREGSGLITGGLGDLRGGMKQIGGGLDLVGGGLDQLAAGLPEGQVGAGQISDAAAGIQAIAASLADCLTGGGTPCSGNPSVSNIAGSISAGGTALQGAAGQVGTVSGGIGATLSGVPDCDETLEPACTPIEGAIATALGLNANIPALVAGIQGGLTNIIGGANGIQAIVAGLSACLTGGGTPCSGNPSVSNIAGQIQAGALQLAEGIAEAIDGVGQLTDGVGELSDGMTEALDGVGELHDGSRELTSGLGDAVEGSRALTVGLGEAASGSARLTDGLGRAADGSGRLAEGQGEAKDGAGQIEQGVYSINELGLQEIARGANQTADELARALALMRAQDRRAEEDSLTYGPPSADNAETVVGGASIVLTMDQLDNRSSESAGRGVTAGVAFLIVLAIGLLATRMRRPQLA